MEGSSNITWESHLLRNSFEAKKKKKERERDLDSISSSAIHKLWYFEKVISCL
jgi:hypothetical protein